MCAHVHTFEWKPEVNLGSHSCIPQELSWRVCHVHAGVRVSCVVPTCRGQRKMSGISVTLFLIPLRQGLSLNLELVWQPVNRSDLLCLPFIALDPSKRTDGHRWLFYIGIGDPNSAP